MATKKTVEQSLTEKTSTQSAVDEASLKATMDQMDEKNKETLLNYFNDPQMPTTDPRHAESPQGFKFVSRVAYGDEEVSEEPIKVPVFEGPTAKVRGGAKFTKNLGNYQSATVSIEIEMPCYPTDEEIVRVSDHVNELIGAILSEQVENIPGA